MNKILWLLVVAIIMSSLYASNHSITDSILESFMAGPTKELFKAYHLIYKKEYDLNTELALTKYKNFKANLKYIKEENNKGNSYTLGIGPFTDMSNAEFKKFISLGKSGIPKQFSENKNVGFIAPIKYTPGKTKINWTKFLGPARDQGQCGSCWAFSTAGAIEGNYMKNFSKSVSLSTQQLIDCSTKNYGCDGGWPSLAMDYIVDNGIEFDSAYPYFSGNSQNAGTCNTIPNSANKLLADYSYCQNCTMDQWLGLLAQGPVTVVIDAITANIQNYRSGILTPGNCGQADHAVVAVGIDSDPTLGDYLIIRNSWSSNWGENGYFRLQVSTGTSSCQLTTYAYLPNVVDPSNPKPTPKPTPGPSPTPPVPTWICPKLYDNCFLLGPNISMCDSLGDLTPVNFMDKTSSVSMGNANKVSLFKKPGCIGDVLTLTTNSLCLATSFHSFTKKFNNRVESVCVEMSLPPQGCVFIYTNCCNLGTKVQLCDSVADLNTVKINNMISAIQFGLGVSHVSLFHSTNYEGLSYGWNNSIACINQGDSQLFNQKASSLRLVK